MIKKHLEKIRTDIQILAKQFSLKYKENLFKVSFVTKRQHVILKYLTGCPAAAYVKFGKTKREHIKRIDEFLNSNEFSSLIKEQGGCVINKKDIQTSIKKLKNEKLKRELNSILKRLKFTPFGSIILTKPETLREKRFLKTILFHEWIHILLNSNRIYFQRIKRKYWTLDEGLVTYLQTFYGNKKSDISKIIEKQFKSKKATDLFKTYGRNALKWNKILKNKNIPEERKKAIFVFYKKLKS